MPYYNDISLYNRHSYPFFRAPYGNFCVDKIQKPPHCTSAIPNLS